MKKIPFLSSLFILSYFVTKDFLDRFGDTFSYQREGMISEGLSNALFLIILALHLGTWAVFVIKTRKVMTTLSHANRPAEARVQEMEETKFS